LDDGKRLQEKPQGQRSIVVRTLKLASLLACCAVVANVYAQDEGRRGRRNNDQPPGASGQTTTETTTQEGRGGRRGFARGGMAGGAMAVTDRDLATMLTFGNQGEVEMATFVKDKSQNDQVKQFAEHMISDHSAFLQQLNQIAGRGAQPGAAPVGNAANANPPAGEAPGGLTPRANNAPVGVGTPPAGGGVDVAAGGVHVGVGGGPGGRSFYAPGMNPLLSIKQEICQECLANEKKELEQKQGVELDKCYIGSQIAKHQEMASALTVLQRHAQDSQFKEMLTQGLQKTQQHLEMAKDIMKKLEQQKAGQ